MLLKTLAALTAGCVVSVSSAQAAVQLDQTSVPAGVASGFTGAFALPADSRLEQSFVSGLTGALDAVDLALEFNLFMPQDAGFTFTLLSDVGATLWTQRVDVPADYRPASGLFRLDLSAAGLAVASGRGYRLQLLGDPGLALSWLTRPGSSYALGDAEIVTSGGAQALEADFGFRTYVDVTAAVPEPATWALMILGFGAAGAALRRGRGVTAAIRG